MPVIMLVNKEIMLTLQRSGSQALVEFDLVSVR
jgi:hypothetical protein